VKVAPAVVAQLAQPRQQRETEHALRKFAPLLDPNPRAMKRFVNAYGIARVVLTLESTLVSSDTLALWTILRSRWPMLAERLAKEPDLIASIVSHTPPPADLPLDLRRLHDAGEVQRVVTFARGGPLTPDLIRAAAGGSAPGVGEPSAGAAPPAANPSA
jgi:hypothetical protein